MSTACRRPATTNTKLNPSALAVAAAVLALFPLACVPDLNRPFNNGYDVHCETQVLHCASSSSPPSLGPLTPNYYQLIQDVRADQQKKTTTPYQVYTDRQVFIFDLSEARLQGSTLVRTAFADRLANAADFVQITSNEDLDGVYLAFDSRGKPNWLLDTSIYQPLPSQVTVSLSLSTGKFLTLDLYRIQNSTRGAKIPSNNYQNHWGGATGLPVGDDVPAMYIVFIKPKELLDCTNNQPAAPSIYDDCLPPAIATTEAQAVAQAEVNAATRCKNNRPGEICLKPQCTAKPSICEANTRQAFLKISPLHYDRDSFVEFNSAQSHLSGSLSEQSFATSLSGRLDFTYELDDLRVPRGMRIYQMRLTAPGFAAGEVDVGPIEIRLMRTASAGCLDPFPVPARPCADYRVPVEELIGSAVCTLNGDDGGSVVELLSPLEVHLDADRTSFNITGQLETHIDIDGQSRAITLMLDLTGNIHYAPRAAAGTEGNPFAECAEHANATPILLNAASSFDLDGAPATTSYDWYEDFDLPTQYHWGQGQLVSIPAYRLG